MRETAEPDKEFKPYEPSTGHAILKNFLRTIARSNLPAVEEKLSSALAISLRVDRSVDRIQLNNKYVIAKVVLLNGTDEVLFFESSQHFERGAKGTFNH